MPYRRQYYDPFVEPVAPVAFVEPPAPVAEPVEPVAEVAPTATQQQPISGLYVERGGIYLHTEDVVTALRQMAEETDALVPMTPKETLLAAAASFQAIHAPDEP